MDDVVKFINKSLGVLYKNPDSLVFAPLADAYRRQGAFKKAVQICVSGVERHTGYAPGYAVLGRIYFELQKYRKAVEYFEKALDLDPGNLLSLRYLSELYIRLKDVKKALCIYEMLLLYDPKDAQVKNIVNKIHSAHLSEYGYFSERPLREVARDLSQMELSQQPSIRPLKLGVAVEPSKEALVSQMLSPVPCAPLPESFSKVKAERDRKLKILQNLMNRLNS